MRLVCNILCSRRRSVPRSEGGNDRWLMSVQCAQPDAPLATDCHLESPESHPRQFSALGVESHTPLQTPPDRRATINNSQYSILRTMYWLVGRVCESQYEGLLYVMSVQSSRNGIVLEHAHMGYKTELSSQPTFCQSLSSNSLNLDPFRSITINHYIKHNPPLP